jgi:hypothetical protein
LGTFEANPVPSVQLLEERLQQSLNFRDLARHGVCRLDKSIATNVGALGCHPSQMWECDRRLIAGQLTCVIAGICLSSQMDGNLGKASMANLYRVIDLRPDTQVAEDVVDGVSSPEAAARKALDLDLVRSGSRKDLIAQVYWKIGLEATNMVRLYARAGGTRGR